MRDVFAIASGKGGVGKSTIAANLALALTTRGRRVGILDADVYGPDIPALFGITRRRPARSVLLASRRPVALEPIERHGVRLMSTQFLIAEDQTISWSAGLVDILLRRFFHHVAWGDTDTLVVDLPPGTADVQQRFVAELPLSEALIVVTPQDVAHLDAKKALAMFGAANVPVVGAVENMAGLSCPHCAERIEVFPTVDESRSIWALGIPRLLSIPIDPLVAAGGDAGVPAVLADPEGARAQSFLELADALLRP